MSSVLRKTVYLVAGLAPVMAIYVANPSNRVHSYHGLCHGALAYQVANGFVPPSHPYLGGYPMRYHWGYHFLSGLITRILEITPFQAFAIINTLSLLIALIFVFRIGRRLLVDEAAGLLATFVAIYAATGISLRMIKDHLPSDFTLLNAVDWKGTPAFEKFTNINGAPAGVAAFAVGLYALIRICEGRPDLPRALLLFVSLAGCGFFYTPMFPALIAMSAAAWAVTAWIQRAQPLRQQAMRLLAIGGASVGAVAAMWPYFRAVGEGYSGRMHFLDREWMTANLINVVVAFLPLGLLVLMSAKKLAARCNKVALAVTATACGTTGLMFLCIHQPWRTEYKYLILSMVAFGILGGIALFLARDWFGRTGVVILAALLLTNPAYEVAMKWNFRENKRAFCAERDRDLVFQAKGGDELYAWIRDHTPVSSLFIDTTNWIPIFGQRALYVSTNDQRTCGIRVYDLFRVTDESIRARRRWLADALLSGQNLPSETEGSLGVVDRPLYVVARSARLASRLDRNHWILAFRSQDQQRSVFQLRGSGSATAAEVDRFVSD